MEALKIDIHVLSIWLRELLEEQGKVYLVIGSLRQNVLVRCRCGGGVVDIENVANRNAALASISPIILFYCNEASLLLPACSKRL